MSTTIISYNGFKRHKRNAILFQALYNHSTCYTVIIKLCKHYRKMREEFFFLPVKITKFSLENFAQAFVYLGELKILTINICNCSLQHCPHIHIMSGHKPVKRFLNILSVFSLAQKKKKCKF